MWDRWLFDVELRMGGKVNNPELFAYGGSFHLLQSLE